MRIAVIGAGSVGATLGQAWLKHGEDETWGLRNPADPSVADQGVAITTMSASSLASLAS